MIALSPSESGAVHVTLADGDAGCAATAVGAVGTTAVNGVTELDCADAGPDPFGLMAWTVNV